MAECMTKLTDEICENVTAKDIEYKLYDGHGLYLLITSNGRKYFRSRYRFNGKERTYSYGVFPEVSLTEAREKLAALRKILRDNIDPQLAKTQSITTPVPKKKSISRADRKYYVDCFYCMKVFEANCSSVKHCTPLCKFHDTYIVNQENGCWEWKNHVTADGTIHIKINKVAYTAPRFAYEEYFGKIQDKAYVLRSCRNIKCVNPDHLYLFGSSMHAINDRREYTYVPCESGYGNKKVFVDEE